MKNIFNKLYLVFLFVTAAAMQGCIKDNYAIDATNNTSRLITEFSEGTKEIVKLNLSAGATAPLTVDLTELRAVPRSVFSGSYTVKLTMNDSLLQAYNDANGTSYEVPPASAVELLATDYTITPDAKFVPVKVKVNTADLLGKSYAIGLRIEQVSSGEISTLAKNVLVAISVKNALEDTYKWDFTRWNDQTGTSTPTSASFKGDETVFATVSEFSNEVASGYFFGPRYVISFKNTGGVLSDFTLKMNDDDVAELDANGITIISGPNILTADYETKRFKFQYTVYNGAAYRYLIDEYYQ
jgi:hypothetical protein